MLGEVKHWDEATRRVVLSRLQLRESLRFFTPSEAAILSVLADLVLDQDSEPKVPVVPVVDQRMADRETDGYRYDDMPEDWVAWRRSLAALDELAHRHHGQGFVEIDDIARTRLMVDVAEGRGDGTGLLADLPAARVWNLWTRYLVDAFYRHPWAWNEIGFGGPAYPRGYRLSGTDRREPWESPDQSPDWPAPLSSVRAGTAEAPHATEPQGD